MIGDDRMQKVNIRSVTLAIIFLLILVVVALLIGNFTYSYVGADLSDDVTTTGETTASGDTIIFSSGNTLTLQATTDNFNAISNSLTDTTNPSARLIASSKTNNASSTYNAGIKILDNTYTYSTEDHTAEVILTVRDDTGAIITTSSDNKLTYTEVTDARGSKISGFDITGMTGAFNIVTNHAINTTSSTTGTTQTWEFTVTFVNYTYDQSINENASMEMEVVLQRDEINLSLAEACSGKTLADCITTQVYTGVDGENGIYLHDGTGDYVNSDQEAGDNSYRYSGANPNNYVCFGSDEASCPNDNLYRIIGVFNNQVKLIKATFYGDYAWDVVWDVDGDVDGDSTWDESTKPDIYTTLNTTYYNTIPAEWQNLIAESTWQVGGMAWIDTNTAKQYYDVEVGTGQSGYEEIMKIGLMYVSDYGYGASPDNWTTALSNYDNSTNTDNNWLYLGGDYEWTLSLRWVGTYSAFSVGSDGSVHNNTVNGNFGVRPSFSLASTVETSSGTGTSTDPFILQTT